MTTNLVPRLSAAVAALVCAASAVASPVTCKDTSLNYMQIDTAYVSSCIDAGLGNIGQAGGNDVFLQNNPGYSLLAGSLGGFTTTTANATQSTGTFSIDPSYWATHSNLFIGFKFGTGNTPDEWFVYQLVNGVSSGDWTFFSVLINGQGAGGLSHLALYSDGSTVPEPATLGLAGLALLGLAMARRRKSQ
jgi:hypothetical protein